MERLLLYAFVCGVIHFATSISAIDENQHEACKIAKNDFRKLSN
jgi:hypothetical protein